MIELITPNCSTDLDGSYLQEYYGLDDVNVWKYIKNKTTMDLTWMLKSLISDSYYNIVKYEFDKLDDVKKYNIVGDVSMFHNTNLKMLKYLTTIRDDAELIIKFIKSAYEKNDMESINYIKKNYNQHITHDVLLGCLTHACYGGNYKLAMITEKYIIKKYGVISQNIYVTCSGQSAYSSNVKLLDHFMSKVDDDHQSDAVDSVRYFTTLDNDMKYYVMNKYNIN
jgi:hypothetical protein